MPERQTQIQIPERNDDEPPASAEQLQLIRQLTTGLSLQGYRFDYRKLGNQQATTIIDQLLAMNDQQTPPPAPRKQGPGCVASLVRSTTALAVFLVVLAGVAGGAYLIYNHIQNNPKPTATADTDNPAEQADTDRTNPSDRPGSTTTGSTIFEGLGVSDSPTTPTDPAPITPDTTTDRPETTPTPDPTPTPTVGRELTQQLAGLEKLLVNLSQYTRNDFARDIRDQSSQALYRNLDTYPQALAALDATDPTLSLRIRAAIDAFAAQQVDGPALREDIKALRSAIDALQ